MLKTRYRQQLLVDSCLLAKQRFVLDNTNVLRSERAASIARARAAHFAVVGYFFEPDVDRAIAWNRQRTGKALIPIKGVLGTLKRLERPSPEEGFDQLYRVRIDREGRFHLEPYGPEQ